MLRALGDRSIAPLATLPALAALSWLIMSRDYEYWRVDAGWAWMTWSVQAIIICPILGGVAAWIVSEKCRHGRLLWLASTGSGHRYLACSLLPTLAVGACFAVASGVVVAFALPPWSPFWGSWIVFGLINWTSSLLISIAVGALLGRFWPSRLAPAVASVGLWALAVGAGRLLGLGDLFNLDGASIPLVGYMPVFEVALNRLAVAILVVGVFGVLISPRALRARRAATRAGLGVLAVTLLAIAYAPGVLASTDDVRSNPHAAATSCASSASGSTSACVMPEAVVDPADLAEGFEKLNVAYEELDVVPWREYRQAIPYRHYRSVNGELKIGREERMTSFTLPVDGNPVTSAVLSTLVHPECAAPDGSDSLAWGEATSILLRWAGLSVGARAEELSRYISPHDPALQSFDTMTDSEQADYLRAALSAVEACDGSLLETL